MVGRARLAVTGVDDCSRIPRTFPLARPAHASSADLPSQRAVGEVHDPHWRLAQTDNLDHFERARFPVRIGSVRELGPIVDTMQEKRFAKYVSELGGLSDAEYDMTLAACRDAVLFQMTFLPHREPCCRSRQPLLSALALYKKLRGVDETFTSVLEIGPGRGAISSFFLKHHRALDNYSQIEHA